MPTAGNAISVDGLTQFRNAVKNLDKDVAKQFRKDLKSVAEVVAADARSRMPVVTGAAQASVKASTSGSYVQVRGGGDSAPYYPWLDFGGLLRPTGGRRNYIKRTHLKKGRYLYPTIDEHRAELVTKAEQAVRTAARSAGLL